MRTWHQVLVKLFCEPWRVVSSILLSSTCGCGSRIARRNANSTKGVLSYFMTSGPALRGSGAASVESVANGDQTGSTRHCKSLSRNHWPGKKPPPGKKGFWAFDL